ncbi:hypothetical protein D3OALGB2SA_3051 [Olavius algarvensis associated proteobacterium Delta 3]|nr:hypothetical protein D3OALGB2SA_3051 [Olavius algarvensis associated proteobacterium Delta 3]
MNAQTQVVFVFTLWLVMGIGFLAKATEMRRLGQTWLNTVTSIEGILFLLSLLAPVFLLIHRSISM